MVPIAVVDRLGPSLYAAGERRRPGAGARPHSRSGGAIAAGPQAAGLGLPPRPEVAAVLDRAARAATPVIKPMPKRHTMGIRNGNRLKPLTGRAYLRRAPLRFGAVMQRKEAKGKEPLATPALSRAGARRAPERVSKVRPDAEEILRLVLARLDDMKAEDTVTIDLTGKSSIADSMVVTSGRSNRHVGAVADRVLRGPRQGRRARTCGSRACRTATGC